MDQNLDHDHRQDNEQGPFQKLAVDKRETLMTPQLQTEYDVYDMEYLVGQYQVTCSVCPSLQV